MSKIQQITMYAVKRGSILCKNGVCPTKSEAHAKMAIFQTVELGKSTRMEDMMRLNEEFSVVPVVVQELEENE